MLGMMLRQHAALQNMHACNMESLAGRTLTATFVCVKCLFQFNKVLEGGQEAKRG